MGGSPLSKKVLNTRLFKDYISIQIWLDTYDGLADPREYVLNVLSSLELVIQDSDSMCKIFLITFWRSTCAWYNSLELSSIEGFSLCQVSGTLQY
jgi:hypothetical protein